MLVDRKCIKFAPRVKDINRQFEMNNNGEVDNGVYNKFVKQSTEGSKKVTSSLNGESEENSLVSSVNKQGN